MPQQGRKKRAAALERGRIGLFCPYQIPGNQAPYFRKPQVQGIFVLAIFFFYSD